MANNVMRPGQSFPESGGAMNWRLERKTGDALGGPARGDLYLTCWMLS